MADDFMLPEALKAQAWEEAKGKLRAVVALQGCYRSGVLRGDRWEALSAEVGRFIKEVEDNALHE